ncbi:MAG: hypothetical protein ACOYD1_07910 [Candidatus Nanopelagicales bacterium]
MTRMRKAFLAGDKRTGFTLGELLALTRELDSDGYSYDSTFQVGTCFGGGSLRNVRLYSLEVVPREHGDL